MKSEEMGINKYLLIVRITIMFIAVGLSGCTQTGIYYNNEDSTFIFEEIFFVLYGNITNSHAENIEVEYLIETVKSDYHSYYSIQSPTIYLSPFEVKDFSCNIKNGYSKYYFSLYCYNKTRECFVSNFEFTNPQGKDIICQIELKSNGKIEISTNYSSVKQNRIPNALARVSATRGTVPLTISFTGIGEDSDGNITSYHWDFGDGETSNKQNTTHVFQDTGTYNVRLTVIDDKGANNTDEIIIKAQCPKPDFDSAGNYILANVTDVFPEPDFKFPEYESDLNFGISADAHAEISNFDLYITAMNQWNPMFIIDLGDWATECTTGDTTPLQHSCQLNRLIEFYCNYSSTANIPDFYVIGNHDVGWINGGDEYYTITIQDLYDNNPHQGAHILKREFVYVTGIPHRYYAFSIKANHTWYRFYVLDGNNKAVNATGHDEGQTGDYWIDDQQLERFENDLKQHRDYKKIVFCHEELFYNSSIPCTNCHKSSYIDNGWKVRELLSADGNTIICFAGHRHCYRRAIYDGVHYITLPDMHHDHSSYVKVTITTNELIIRQFFAFLDIVYEGGEVRIKIS